MKLRNIILAIVISVSFSIISCEGVINEKNISAHNNDESHNMGRNCMDCHKKGGQGKGWFIVAGTVYDYNSDSEARSPNGTVYLYSDKERKSLVATIEVDNLGNFYNTDNISFGSGLYPTVVSISNDTRNMTSSITQGACNGCHNVTTYKIFVK
jgi:hypothetical protein